MSSERVRAGSGWKSTSAAATLSITRITAPTREASRASDEEEPAPCAPVSENEDDNAGSDAEQASMAQKRRETGVT